MLFIYVLEFETKMKTLKKIALFTILFTSLNPLQGAGGQTSWPTISPEMKPGTRWWWMGSAVDKANLQYNLEEYARVGIGSVEITPIYGVQKNAANEIPFLSEKWMNMLSFTQATNKRVGIQTDMNTGTGWPFGGPEVSIEEAASKLFVREYVVKGGEVFSETIVPKEKEQQKAKLLRVMAFGQKKVLNLTKLVTADKKINWKAPKSEWTIIAAFNGKTFQMVKRAAPGGEG